MKSKDTYQENLIELDVQGIRTVVRLAGPQDSDHAIVLLHGNPGSSEDWQELMPSLSNLGRVVAPDMPGYGMSERPKNFDATVPAYGRHLAAVLKQLGVSKVHLVLHDFGGPWGMAWASEHFDQLASMTLCNTGILPGYRWHKWARVWQTPIIGELFMRLMTYPAFRFLMNLENPKPLPEKFLNDTYKYIDWGLSRIMLRLYRSVPDMSALSLLYGKQVASKQGLPVLVIWGAEDKTLPVKFAPIQKQFFPSATVHEMHDCGHWPFIDAPEEFNQIIIPFLQKNTGRFNTLSIDMSKP